jgi:hypothetical protein
MGDMKAAYTSIALALLAATPACNATEEAAEETAAVAEARLPEIRYYEIADT